MTKQLSDERLLNTRNWAEARLGQLSGAEVIVGAIDEVFALRGLLEHLHQYLPDHGRQRVVEILAGQWTRYPAHDMAQALREIGAMIPSAAGGTFENDPPGAIVGALKTALAQFPWGVNKDMTYVPTKDFEEMKAELEALRAQNRP